MGVEEKAEQRDWRKSARHKMLMTLTDTHKSSLHSFGTQNTPLCDQFTRNVNINNKIDLLTVQ